MMRLKIIFISIISCAHLRAQYAAPAGQAGSTAIHRDSSVFVSWAWQCEVIRGYQDISNPSLGFASVGTGASATGKADMNNVVSLGDGGEATLTFPYLINNGSGPDFAVFENSITDDFLELAFVEVSSDGINFFRFASHSLSDTVTQTDGFGSTDAKKINNLAGKYRMGYGTPFDLEALKNEPGLNVNAVSHVRIIDVVGAITSSYARRDSYNNIINDPWPTPFPSSGFDLDAVGVIHRDLISGISDAKSNKKQFTMYPNPAARGEFIHLNVNGENDGVEIKDISGKVLVRSQSIDISTKDLVPGLYFVTVYQNGSNSCVKLFIY